MYQYKAEVLAVTDGDTVDLLIDLGFDPVYRRLKRARLYGLDAPEKNTIKGKEVKAWLEAKLPVGSTVFVQTVKVKAGEKQEKYGGFLVNLFINNFQEVSLNQQMLDFGYAKPYYGGAR